jgi:hypothetical protein
VYVREQPVGAVGDAVDQGAARGGSAQDVAASHPAAAEPVVVRIGAEVDREELGRAGEQQLAPGKTRLFVVLAPPLPAIAAVAQGAPLPAATLCLNPRSVKPPLSLVRPSDSIGWS